MVPGNNPSTVELRVTGFVPLVTALSSWRSWLLPGFDPLAIAPSYGVGVTGLLASGGTLLERELGITGLSPW